MFFGKDKDNPAAARPTDLPPPAEPVTPVAVEAPEAGGQVPANPGAGIKGYAGDNGVMAEQADYFTVDCLKQVDVGGVWQLSSQLFPTLGEAQTYGESLREGRHASIAIIGHRFYVNCA